MFGFLKVISRHITARRDIMESCTYFILSVILFLISFGTASGLIGTAVLVSAGIFFAGGLFTKFIVHS